MVLSPVLFEALRDRFGYVGVTYEDEPLQWRRLAVPDATTGVKWSITYSGEYYSVNCPHCSDTRHRMTVNHMYGQPDPVDSARRMTWLVHCFNEDCFKSRARQIGRAHV